MSPKPTVMYTVPSLPKTIRDALPDGIAEKRSLTSTSPVPSQRPRANVIVPAPPPPRPAGGAAAAIGAPGALPPRPPAAAAFPPRPSCAAAQGPVGGSAATVVVAAGLWYVKYTNWF